MTITLRHLAELRPGCARTGRAEPNPAAYRRAILLASELYHRAKSSLPSRSSTARRHPGGHQRCAEVRTLQQERSLTWGAGRDPQRHPTTLRFDSPGEWKTPRVARRVCSAQRSWTGGERQSRCCGAAPKFVRCVDCRPRPSIMCESILPSSIAETHPDHDPVPLQNRPRRSVSHSVMPGDRDHLASTAGKVIR